MIRPNHVIVLVVLGALLHFADGRTATGFVAVVVAIICIWSHWHMLYFARQIARARIFVEALTRGDFELDSPESERYWREIVPIVEPAEDANSIPDWITRINMLATIVGIGLFAWGCLIVLA